MERVEIAGLPENAAAEDRARDRCAPTTAPICISWCEEPARERAPSAIERPEYSCGQPQDGERMPQASDLYEHRNTVARDREAVGQAQQCAIGIARALGRPAVEVGALGQVGLERVGQRGRGSPTGGDEGRATLFPNGCNEPQQAISDRSVVDKGLGRAAQEDGDQGTRPVGDFHSPLVVGRGHLGWIDAQQGKPDRYDVVEGRKLHFDPPDHEIEALHPARWFAHENDLRVPARLCADPEANVRRAAAVPRHYSTPS